MDRLPLSYLIYIQYRIIYIMLSYGFNIIKRPKFYPSPITFGSQRISSEE